MSRFETSGRHLAVLAALMALAGVVTGAAGCDPTASDGLVVATSWPPADRRRLESEFQNWIKSSNGLSGAKAIEIHWLLLGPGDDLLRVIARRHPPDVLLGVRASSLEHLARQQHISPLRDRDSAVWLALPHAPIERQLTPPNIPIDDPRSDPISLARALSQLNHGRFADGYSRLVRLAGNPRRIGRQQNRPLKKDVSPEWKEGVAIPRSAAHPDLAEAFMQYLTETRGLTARAGQPTDETDADMEILVADLLGATLVDAQDELWAARAALERAGHPPTALKWMTEPPPWPPASVAKMLDQPGEGAMTLVQTLAREIAPEPAVRAWLVRSWLAPPRLIDDTLLIELARAVDGRLYREPRFRAWLRAEWTAWARQRYRRVLKAASS